MIIAMHIADGLINLPTSALFAALALAAIAFALRGAQHQLDERTAPIAGLTAVFIFAAQMLNFPVAAGTSGHLLGGALAAVLVGPYAATLALTIVLLIQGLLFADGGLTAIGLNVFNMGVLGVWSSYAAFLVARRIIGASKRSVVLSSAVAGFISVPVAAAGFVLQYAIGGTGTYSIPTVLGAMVGTHLLIGVGEAVITMLTVSAVISTRSDLVFGWQGVAPELEVRV